MNKLQLLTTTKCDFISENYFQENGSSLTFGGTVELWENTLIQGDCDTQIREEMYVLI